MNARLKVLYEEDLVDRRSGISDEELDINDQKRISQAQEILSDSNDLIAQDYHHAALIFQHGTSLKHFQKAHELALKAVNLGDDTARWLAAASLDRSLLMDGKPQKYGTQFKLNKDNDWELALPIDASVSDQERAKWHVPPLKDALVVYKKKYNLQ